MDDCDHAAVVGSPFVRAAVPNSSIRFTLESALRLMDSENKLLGC